MTILKKALGLTLLLLVLSVAAGMAAETRYTKYNIHAQQKDAKVANASYANYTNPGVGHVIIPAGTKISIVKSSRRGFDFIYADGRTVRFEFHDKRMGMGIEDYLDLITSPQPVTINKLNAKDKRGVSEGKALVGMSKHGVMTALGYPAAHKTPSPDSSSWVYWQNRFSTLIVDFDENGKVIAVRD